MYARYAGPYIVVAEGLVAAGGGAGAVLPLVLRLLVQGKHL